jgi:hypothetical protein
MGNASVKSHSGHKHSGHKHSGRKHSGRKHYNRRRTRHHRYGGGLSPLNPRHTKTLSKPKKNKQTPFSRAVIVREASKAQVVGNTARIEKAEAEKRIKAAKSQADLDKAERLTDFFKSVDESFKKDMKRHFADKATRRKAAEKKDIEFEARRTARKTARRTARRTDRITGKIKLIKRSSSIKDASA